MSDMNDFDIQLVPAQAEASLSNAWTERLLQRLHQPVGVIDVRQPQQIYARTAGWVGKRLAFLDRWKTRYSSASAAGALTKSSSSPVAFQQSAAEASPSIMAGSSNASPTAAGADHDSAPQQYRVKRRSVPSQPKQPPSNTTQLQIQTSTRGINPATHEVAQLPPQASVDAKGTGNTLQRKKSQAMHRNARSAWLATDASQPYAGQSPVPIRAVGEAGNAQTPWTTIQRRTDTPVDREANASPSLAWNRELSTAGNFSPALSSPAQWAPPVRLTPVTVQRKAAPGSPHVVRELPLHPAASTAGRMIWRKAASTHPGLLAGHSIASVEPSVMQKVSSEPRRTFSSASNPAAPATTATNSSGINVTQVAEDVGRLLARQLVIERERRGRSK